MKKLWLTGVAFAALIASPAMSADLGRPVYRGAAPVVPVFSWTGCYLGGNVGYHWGKDDITTTTAGPAPAVNAFIDNATPTSLKPAGGIAGGQVGCNYQVSNFVIGLEGDADWVGGTASRTLVFGPNPFIGTGDFIADATKATFLATVRGRLGVAFDRVLLFATAGAAFATVKTTDTVGSFGGTAIVTTDVSNSRTGWTAGGGIEYAFDYNWTAKVEYLYVDLGSFNTFVPPCSTCTRSYTVNHKYTDNIARVGLNYKFGYAAAPAVYK
jgi:outer membrane immunogenic protein